MAGLLITSCAGLVTNPNDVGQVPEGALAQADNVQISRDGIIEPRRGFETVGSVSGVFAASALIAPYDGKLVAAGVGSTALAVSSTGASWSALSDVLGAEVTAMAQANSNLYSATAAGIFRTEDATAGHTMAAGIPPASDLFGSISLGVYSKVQGSMLANGSAVAYRALWSFADANGNKIVGAPSTRRVVANAGGAAYDCIVNTTFAAVPTGATVEFYRTASVVSSLDPGDDMSLVGVRTLPAIFGTITSLQRTATTSYPIATTSTTHRFAVGDVISTGTGTVTSGALSFARGVITIASVPSSNTFTFYDDSDLDIGTASGLSLAFSLVAVGMQDSIPDALRGAALYTNPTQGGILASQYPPPVAADVASFRGSLLFANTIDVHKIAVSLLATGSPDGLQVGDTITIDGVAFTGAVGPDYSTKSFLVYTGGTATQNVTVTANSLVEMINRYGTPPHDIQAAYASGANDAPGMIQLWRTSPGGAAFVVSSSRSTAWLGLGTSTAETRPNGISWSQQDKPDAVPLTNFARVGSNAATALRVVPLRDSTIILKTDGVFRLTGETPDNFRIDPLDLTVQCVAQKTAVALENTVFCLSRSGVVRISDTGVTLVSRQIEDQLRPLLVGAMRATTAALAFGVNYDSDHKYILWLPTLSSDTAATQAFVYDVFTESWARWTVGASCGAVNPVDDKLYLATGSSVLQERKALTADDFADRSYAVTIASHTGASVTLSSATNALVGDRIVQGALSATITAKATNTLTLDRTLAWSNAAATVYRAVAVAVKWSPKFGSPGSTMHAREVGLMFRSVYFVAASLGFSTDLSPTGSTLALDGAALGLVDPPTGPRTVRAWIPRAEQRGSRLSVSFSMTQAMCPMQLQGLSVIYEPGGERVSR